MTIDEQIAQYLLDNEGVKAALVSKDVWLCVLPQGRKKGVVVQQISGPRAVTLDAREKVNARWQFTSYAEDPVLCRKIHDAVVAAVTFVRGPLVADGTFVESDSLEDERGPMYDYDRDLYRRDADVVLTY
jgi:hypothetical protein